MPLRGMHITALLLTVTTVLTGCGAGRDSRDDTGPAPGLTVHTGKGFTVGHPEKWTRDPRRRVFRGAEAEVVEPGAAGGPPRAAWSVFTDEHKVPFSRFTAEFIARSRRNPGFRLLESRKLRIDERDAHLLHKTYPLAPSAVSSTTASPRPSPGPTGTPSAVSSPTRGDGVPVRLRQVDLLVHVSTGTVVDVRMVYLADHYDAKQVAAVIDSFRVTR